MTESNKSQYCIELEAELIDLKGQTVIAKRQLVTAKCQLTRSINKKDSKGSINALRGNVNEHETSVKFHLQELDDLESSVRIAGLIDADGTVSIYDLHKVDIDDVVSVEFPVVEVLPMRGDITSEFMGTAAGSAHAATPYLNIEKFAPLIETAFDAKQMDIEAITNIAIKSLEKALAPEVINQVAKEVQAGTREPLQLIGKKVAVIPLIDSPGGSPTEGYNLAMKIDRESYENNIPAFCFSNNGSDSAGYMLLCVGERAFVTTPFTSAGSIGIVAGYNQLTELGRKKSKDRDHILTAGEGKRNTMHDINVETSEKDIAEYQDTLDRYHEIFKDFVLKMRGDLLKGDEDVMFSGKSFSAVDALEYGLIDGIGHYEDVMKQYYGSEVIVYELPITDPSLTPKYETIGSKLEESEIEFKSPARGSFSSNPVMKMLSLK